MLSVLVENKAGVLARVAGLFARRGYNIYSLAVAPTDDERFSRITIVVDVESAPLEQIVKQLHKLINVIKITELDPARRRSSASCCWPPSGRRPDARSQVIELVQMFEGRILDVGHDELTVSLDGSPDKLDDFEELLRPYGIVDLQRTGRVALPKLTRHPLRAGSTGPPRYPTGRDDPTANRTAEHRRASPRRSPWPTCTTRRTPTGR